MDAVITAGGIPQPGEPLYEYTQGGYKAMLEIAGKPMIQWVLDALQGSPLVDRVVIIGLPDQGGLVSSKVIDFLPTQGGLVENVRQGVKSVLKSNPEAKHVLAVSSDIPGITAEMVDWTIRAAMETDHDIYYNVITRQVMEDRFPGSKRSYIHLRGLEVCGGDMNVMRAKTVTGNEELWLRLVNARKSALKQAALVGYDTLFLLLLRVLSIESAEKRASKKLGIRGRAILCPFAEIGMDVDKPHQLEILRAALANVEPA